MKFSSEYQTYLNWVDSLTANVLNTAPPAGPATDDYRADLAGLLTTAYVAAYENCIKSIFISFAGSKNRILSSMASFHFDKINSKIHYNHIGSTYARQFGENYRIYYNKTLDDKENDYLRTHGVSIKESYSNLLKWRHAFAHEGKKLATLEEVVSCKDISRHVIFIIDETMSI